jgi:acyl-CoA thioesterase-1
MRRLFFCFVLALVPGAGRAETPVLLFLGDSVTEGYGVPPTQAYPRLVEKNLLPMFPGLRIINGAVSGSLSSSLESRLRFFVSRDKPTHVFIAIGGNDARQGTSPAQIRSQIQAGIDLARREKVLPILAGFRIFTNLGEDFARRFAAVYPALAQKNKIPLIPFLLEGVGGVPEYNLPDGFHPNAKGHQKIAELVTPRLRDELRKWQRTHEPRR